MPVGENPGSKSYDYSDDPERQKLEDFLESKRPPGSCSRLTSWFACDDPAKSARYLDGELNYKKKADVTGQPRLYAIEFGEFSRQPMILVNTIRNTLATNDAETAEKLATEYWRPTRDWKFWEYTAPEIRIVAEVEWPDSMALQLAFMAYQGDDGRLKQMLRSR
jgi:hypothetical protein